MYASPQYINIISIGQKLMFTCKFCFCYTCECSSRFSWVNIFIQFGSSRKIMLYTVLHSFSCASLSVILGVVHFLKLISAIVPEQITICIFLIFCCEWYQHDNSWTSDVGVIPLPFSMELWQRVLKNIQLLWRFFVDCKITWWLHHTPRSYASEFWSSVWR